MLHLEPRQMSGCVAKPFRLAIGLLLVCLGLTMACGARELSGAWLSPDWFLPGDRDYREQDIRKIARRTLAELADDGVDTVFSGDLFAGLQHLPHHQS
jgi:hypothetical protein